MNRKYAFAKIAAMGPKEIDEAFKIAGFSGIKTEASNICEIKIDGDKAVGRFSAIYFNDDGECDLTTDFYFTSAFIFIDLQTGKINADFAGCIDGGLDDIPEGFIVR
jgi:hypothetical protein